MYPSASTDTAAWGDRIEVPAGMQRPFGIVFGGLALLCVLAAGRQFVVPFLGLILGLFLSVRYLTGYTQCLVIWSCAAGLVSLLMGKRPEPTASGR